VKSIFGQVDQPVLRMPAAIPLTVVSRARSSASTSNAARRTPGAAGGPSPVPVLAQQGDLQVMQRQQVGVADAERAGQVRLVGEQARVAGDG